MFNLSSKKNSPYFIGVAGTKGKTITPHLIAHLLKAAGKKVSYLTTLGYEIENKHTLMPNANHISRNEFNKIINKAKNSDSEFIIVELTSKNIVSKVYEKIDFDTLVMTNLKPENFEYYGSYENYIQTKTSIINLLKGDGKFISDPTDPEINKLADLVEQSAQNKISIEKVDYTDIYNITYFHDGTAFFLRNVGQISTKLIGRFNVSYIMLALLAARTFISAESVIKAFETFEPPAGRLDLFSKDPYNIVIDYANTAEAIEEGLYYLKQVKNPETHLITITGGSSTNKFTKDFGKIAAQYSDLVILTAQDPLDSTVANLNSQIHSEAEKYGGIMLDRFTSTEEIQLVDKNKLKYKIEMVQSNQDIPFISFDAEHYSSRLDAIKFAVSIAKPGDFIYLSGKGHETLLRFKDIEYEWSDYQAVKIALGL